MSLENAYRPIVHLYNTLKKWRGKTWEEEVRRKMQSWRWQATRGGNRDDKKRGEGKVRCGDSPVGIKHGNVDKNGNEMQI